MDSQMVCVAGLDIGNGYVKGLMSFVGANGSTRHVVDLPSCVVWRSNASDVPQAATDARMADLVNELDCDIASPAIRTSERSRILVGKRAVASGLMPVIFNIDATTPKCDEALSYQLILSCIAAEALSQAWSESHELPEEKLHVTCYLGVALPISDFTHYRGRYRASLMGGIHTVYVKNFEREVTVEITFADVGVDAEGAAAQYAIVGLGPEFMDRALDEARAAGMPIDEEETGEQVIAYDNTMSVDIGEGTVNFPVFRDGEISVESSSTISQGYGTMLDSVVEATRGFAFAPRTRKDLAEFLLKERPNPRDRQIRRKLEPYIEKATSDFVRAIEFEFTRIFSRIKLDLDVIYVYGGGASAMYDALYPVLVHQATFDDGLTTPIIWLDSSYSRDLNRNGLYLLAKTIYEQEAGRTL